MVARLAHTPSIKQQPTSQSIAARRVPLNLCTTTTHRADDSVNIQGGASTALGDHVEALQSQVAVSSTWCQFPHIIILVRHGPSELEESEEGVERQGWRRGERCRKWGTRRGPNVGIHHSIFLQCQCDGREYVTRCCLLTSSGSKCALIYNHFPNSETVGIHRDAR